MSKKLPIYFSDAAWASLQLLMGEDGSPSPTINHLLELVTQQPADSFKVSSRSKVFIPIALERVSAGFPSPAQDHIEDSIDLNEHLLKNPLSSFIVRVGSESMLNAGFEVGDEIVVDRSLPAEIGDVVIALVNNDYTLKRLAEWDGRIYLKAENPLYRDIHLGEGEELVIWGVVTYNLKKIHRRKK